MKPDFSEQFQKWVAPVVLIVVFLWSSIVVFQQTYQSAPKSAATQPAVDPDAITLHVAHWQLEAGVREGFEKMAREYRETVNPHVYIVQDAIPEGSYGQWVTSQFLGGTPPDMVEMGLGLPPPVWLSFKSRYFLSSSDDAQKPNPYNKGTDLENTPLSQTYLDGMQSTYTPELQQYIGYSLSQFGSRLSYNRDLLRKLTGLETPPSDYRAFLAMCDKISAQKDDQGRPYFPIASSQYHAGMWDWRTCAPMTYGVMSRADFNHDGSVGNDELFAAIRCGLVKFDDPEIRARFTAFRQLCDRFQNGFSGLGRDEAVFLWAQQRAVIIPCGTWDALSYQTQGKAGHFDVQVCDFPQISPNDPEFGKVVFGPPRDHTDTGFCFGVTRGSKHPEIARDFMLFLASKKNNEKLNAIIGWIPAIKGAKLPPVLGAFDIKMEGTYDNFNPNLGGNTVVKWGQDISNYQIGQTTYEQFMKSFGDFYLSKGMLDMEEMNRNRSRSETIQERLLVPLRAAAISAPTDQAPGLWAHYHELVANTLVFNEIGSARIFRLIVDKPDHPIAPYEYTPQIKQIVRERIAHEKKQTPP